ncbi:MAG: SusC/RagA family TonB-linked outer membrane protein [Bacteroidia bacterium]
MKQNIYLIALFVMLSISALAQERKITGTVTNAKDNSTIPGVTVTIKGTTQGAIADINGHYEIMLPQGSNTLVFSFVGMKKKEVPVGVSDIVNASMEDENVNVGEVVVTALGVSREKKSLGYATQEISGSQVTDVKSGNFVNQLSGKVSGVQVKNNGNMGGSTNVIIRGTSSLLGDNQALFIVDGVPIDNSRSNVLFQNRGTAGYDYGSPVSDINPEDIESINVLKGAAATALYGSRAARGVILITTKKGKTYSTSTKKRVGITFNSNFTMGIVDKETFPTYQNEYGAGYGPYYDGPGGHFFLENVTGSDTAADGSPSGVVTPYTEDASYGEHFDPNLMVYQWDAFVPGSSNYHVATPWVGHASDESNGPISFFENSMSYTNSIAFDGGSDKGTFRVSFANTTENGIMPNSKLDRYNYGINGSFNLTDKLTVSASANYIKTATVGRNETGYNNNIMTSFREWYETNVSVAQLKEMYDLTGGNYGWNPASSSDPAIPIYWDNPYFQRFKSFSSDQRDRFYGNVALNYKVNSWFDLMMRGSIDMYSTLQEERIAKTSNAKQFGIGQPGQAPPDATSGYSRLNKDVKETNFDLMATFKKEINDNLSFSGLLGTNIRRNNLNTIFAATNGGLVVPELYSISNSVETPSASVEHEQNIGVNGYFASVSLGYQRFLFLDLTARQDYSSTLPENKNGFFYPGASASFVFSEKLKNLTWLDFGKVRASIAQVGNDAPWGSILDVYDKPIAFGSTTLFTLPITKNNSDLKPELSLTKEAGLEMVFFKRRLGFDFAYYTTDTKDQILPVAVTTATGYSSKYVNAGVIQNQGIELNLYGTVVKTKDFSWVINLNFSRNRNKVKELFEGVDNVQLANFQNGVTLNATLGEAYGTLKGTDYVYYVDANGVKTDQKVIGADGYYKRTTTTTNVIGNVNPDYLAGIGNTLSYKNWTFSFLIDIQHGGSVYSLDMAYGMATGLYPESVGNNDLGNPVRNTWATADSGGVILEGVTENGSVNTKRVKGDDYRLWGYVKNPNSEFIYDASYVKLRELTLSYKVPLKANSCFSNATFGIVCSNLWIISKNLPYADPESGLSAGNIQGYQVGVLPSTRNFGFNLTLQF